jgi:hypothetical protein
MAICGYLTSTGTPRGPTTSAGPTSRATAGARGCSAVRTSSNIVPTSLSLITVKKLLTTCRWRLRAADCVGDLELGVAADGSVSGR